MHGARVAHKLKSYLVRKHEVVKFFECFAKVNKLFVLLALRLIGKKDVVNGRTACSVVSNEQLPHIRDAGKAIHLLFKLELVTSLLRHVSAIEAVLPNGFVDDATKLVCCRRVDHADTKLIVDHVLRRVESEVQEGIWTQEAQRISQRFYLFVDGVEIRVI